MRNRLLIAATVGAFLAGCGQQAAEQNQSAVDSNSAAPAAPKANAQNAALGPAVSGEQAKTLMHERHEGMEHIGDAFKIVGRETKSDAPDVAAIQKAAATIASLASQSSGWFPPGTEPDVGKTRAKAEIWQKPQDFAAKDEAFAKAASAFKAAADSGDVAAIKAQAAELGKTCKACHDLYRSEKEAHGG